MIILTNKMRCDVTKKLTILRRGNNEKDSNEKTPAIYHPGSGNGYCQYGLWGIKISIRCNRCKAEVS